MKRIALILLMGFLWGCSASVVEVEEPVVVPPQVEAQDPEVEEREPSIQDDEMIMNETIEEEVDREEAIHEEVEEPVISVSLTSRTDLQPIDVCRVPSVGRGGGTTTGFPIPSKRIPSIGQVRVQVFFIDFPDFAGTRSSEELGAFFQNYIEGIDRYYRTQSYGLLDFEWQVHTEFIRMGFNFFDYNFSRGVYGQNNDIDFVFREAVSTSDAFIDYTDVEMIVIFLNPDIPEELADVSPALLANEQCCPFVTSEGAINNGTFIAGDGVRIGWFTIAHEIGHLLGLDDLIDYNWRENSKSDDWYYQFVFVGGFDLMGAGPRYEWGNNTEFFGWHKFLFDWITEEQVRCLDMNHSGVTYHAITSNHEWSDQEKLVIVRLSQYQALVIEAKGNNEYCTSCQGGLYVTLIDGTKRSGYGSIQLLRPNHSTNQFFIDAFLVEDQQLQYENIVLSHLGEHLGQVILSVEVVS